MKKKYSPFSGRYREKIKKAEFSDKLVRRQISFFQEDNIESSRTVIIEGVRSFFERDKAVTLTHILPFQASVNAINELYPKEVSGVLNQMNFDVDVIDSHLNPKGSIERHCLMCGNAAIRIYLLLGGKPCREMVIFLIWSSIVIPELRKVAVHDNQGGVIEILSEISLFDSKPSLKKELYRELKKAVTRRYGDFPQLVRIK